MAGISPPSKRGYIDKQGKFAIALRFDVEGYEPFTGGLARVLVTYKVNHPMKSGYIDRSGRLIWKPTV